MGNKLVAPDIDVLLRYFDREYMYSSRPSAELCAAMEPLFDALRDLAPLKSNKKSAVELLATPPTVLCSVPRSRNF